MCGIVGYVGKKSVVPVIIEGLRRLEYRGYDSAGIAVAGSAGITVARTGLRPVDRLTEATEYVAHTGDLRLLPLLDLYEFDSAGLPSRLERHHG